MKNLKVLNIDLDSGMSDARVQKYSVNWLNQFRMKLGN